MKISIVIVIILLVVVPAFADFELAKRPEFVECYGANNLIVEIYGDRSKMNVLVAGQGLGFIDVLNERTDGASFFAYRSSVGTLYLDNAGDSFVWADTNEQWSLTCSFQ